MAETKKPEKQNKKKSTKAKTPKFENIGESLTSKQKLFLIELFKHHNATKAYMNVYKVSDRAAQACSSRLLSYAIIKKARDEIFSELMSGEMIDIKARLLNELQSISFSRLSDYIDDEGNVIPEKFKSINPGAVREFVREENFYPKLNMHETVYKVKLADKNKPLEILAKYTGVNKEVEIKADMKIFFGAEEKDL